MSKTRKNAQIFGKSFFSKLRTTQKQTVHSSFASWILAEGRRPSTKYRSPILRRTCSFLLVRFVYVIHIFSIFSHTIQHHNWLVRFCFLRFSCEKGCGLQDTTKSRNQEKRKIPTISSTYQNPPAKHNKKWKHHRIPCTSNSSEATQTLISFRIISWDPSSHNSKMKFTVSWCISS